MELITIGGVTLPRATPEQLARNVARWRQEQIAREQLHAKKLLLKARMDSAKATVGDMVVQKLRVKLVKEVGK